MVNRSFLALCFLFCEMTSASTLCTPSEKVLFSCQLENSKKIASVCAAINLTRTVGYLQYRFGTRGKLELVYPSTKVATQERFFWRELRPYQSSVRELTFKSGEYYYTLSAYDVSEALNDIPGGAQVGQIEVEKSRGSSHPTVLKCVSYPEGEFSLGGLVRDGDDLIGK